MREHSTISEWELHAFIDRELDDKRSQEIAALVKSDAELAALVASYRMDKMKLALLDRDVESEPLPAHWMKMIEDGTRRAPANTVRLSPRRASAFAFLTMRRTAFALAASLFLIVTGWLTYAHFLPNTGDPLVAEAMAARNNMTPPEIALAGDTIPEGEARDHIVATALGQKLKVPDLTKLGYHLAAIRVYAESGGKAVELRYLDAENRRFSLFVRHSSGPARFDLALQGTTRICIWQDDVLGAVMLGEMSAAEMMRLANLAYEGLSA